jgi:hypothetical protein
LEKIFNMWPNPMAHGRNHGFRLSISPPTTVRILVGPLIVDASAVLILACGLGIRHDRFPAFYFFDFRQ